MNLGTLVSLLLLLLTPAVEPVRVLECSVGLEISSSHLRLYVDPVFLVWTPSDWHPTRFASTSWSVIQVSNKLHDPAFDYWKVDGLADYIVAEERIHVEQIGALGCLAYWLGDFMEPPQSFPHDYEHPEELRGCMWTPPKWFPRTWHFFELEIPLPLPVFRVGVTL